MHSAAAEQAVLEVIRAAAVLQAGIAAGSAERNLKAGCLFFKLIFKLRLN